MKKKICFIIPYFGNFKNYFQLFLNSCRLNSDINWLIITDNKDEYDYPKNVKRIELGFNDLRKKIQEKFDFNIPLSKPYKLCDFKVSYGYIFEDQIRDFDFWGYCDTDLIFGNIRKFITDDILDNYDKIGYLGHFTLIKNTSELNRAFALSIDGETPIYEKIFSSNNNYSFDEEFNGSINNIFISNDYKIFTDMNEAGLYTKTSNFKLTKMDLLNHKYNVEKLKKAFFVYDNGSLLRYSNDGNKLTMEEYLYIHFQSRKMKVTIPMNSRRYKIIPNSFDDLEKYPITISNFNKIKRKHFNFHCFRLRTCNLIDKIKKYIRMRFYGKS